MPYLRNTRLVTPLLSWLDLELLEPLAEWSDAYRVESPRLLLPRTHWFECELGGRRRVHDSVSPLWLTPDVAYRMRQPTRGQRSIVLVMHSPRPPARARRQSRTGTAWHGEETPSFLPRQHCGPDTRCRSAALA